MGMEHNVEFGPTGCPTWSSVANLLKECGYPVDMRMIDGELSFPDEVPPDGWRELRVGTPGGVIAVRRVDTGLSVVTWENADAAMRGAWNALTWAFAQASNGCVMH